MTFFFQWSHIQRARVRSQLWGRIYYMIYLRATHSNCRPDGSENNAVAIFSCCAHLSVSNKLPWLLTVRQAHWSILSYVNVNDPPVWVTGWRMVNAGVIGMLLLVQALLTNAFYRKQIELFAYVYVHPKLACMSSLPSCCLPNIHLP